MEMFRGQWMLLTMAETASGSTAICSSGTGCRGSRHEQQYSATAHDQVEPGHHRHHCCDHNTTRHNIAFKRDPLVPTSRVEILHVSSTCWLFCGQKSFRPNACRRASSGRRVRPVGPQRDKSVRYDNDDDNDHDDDQHDAGSSGSHNARSTTFVNLYAHFNRCARQTFQ